MQCLNNVLVGAFSVIVQLRRLINCNTSSVSRSNQQVHKTGDNFPLNLLVVWREYDRDTWHVTSLTKCTAFIQVIANNCHILKLYLKFDSNSLQSSILHFNLYILKTLLHGRFCQGYGRLFLRKQQYFIILHSFLEASILGQKLVL